MIWRTSSGKRVKVTTSRMVSYPERHLGLMSMDLELLDGDAPIVISSQLLNRQDGFDEYHVQGQPYLDGFRAIFMSGAPMVNALAAGEALAQALERLALLGEGELRAFVREHIAHYKCPQTFTFRRELPRLPTGKLYKHKLRDEYWGATTRRI